MHGAGSQGKKESRVLNMKRMSCIDEVEPSWHPSSAGELPGKQQKRVLHHLRPSGGHLWTPGKVLGGGQTQITAMTVTATNTQSKQTAGSSVCFWRVE